MSVFLTYHFGKFKYVCTDNKLKIFENNDFVEFWSFYFASICP
ncbi:hypothetical protein [Raineya orbicola]|nr:hypothetical protein [Raineya orbicola]